MKKITLVTSLVCLLLAGCASQTEWNQNNAKQEKFNSDSFECERAATDDGFYGGIIGNNDMKKFYNKCMLSKGWDSPAAHDWPLTSNSSERNAK